MLGGQFRRADNRAFTQHTVGFGHQHVIVILRPRRVVLMFDQKPVFLLSWHVRAHQIPDSAEFFALQFEFELALGVGLLRIFERNPHAAIPDNHIAGTVMPLGNTALERRVIQRMVFDMHRQTFDLGVERRPFRHRPALQCAIEFQAKVVMQVRSVVLLDAELQSMIRRLFTAGTLDRRRFRCRRKVAHAVVVVEVPGHGHTCLFQPIRVTVSATTAIRSTR